MLEESNTTVSVKRISTYVFNEHKSDQIFPKEELVRRLQKMELDEGHELDLQEFSRLYFGVEQKLFQKESPTKVEYKT